MDLRCAMPLRRMGSLLRCGQPLPIVRVSNPGSVGRPSGLEPDVSGFDRGAVPRRGGRGDG
eukprot:scaffold86_cov338-Pavlova_lutheri.AAC.76